MTQWILGMDNLCHLKRVGLMDELLSKLLLTMAVKRKVAKFGNNNVHDTNLIYSRVL